MDLIIKIIQKIWYHLMVLALPERRQGILKFFIIIRHCMMLGVGFRPTQPELVSFHPGVGSNSSREELEGGRVIILEGWMYVCIRYPEVYLGNLKK
jgi:hypothetical protein